MSLVFAAHKQMLPNVRPVPPCKTRTPIYLIIENRVFELKISFSMSKKLMSITLGMSLNNFKIFTTLKLR